MPAQVLFDLSDLMVIHGSGRPGMPEKGEGSGIGNLMWNTMGGLSPIMPGRRRMRKPKE
jgi:hypothetical protein